MTQPDAGAPGRTRSSRILGACLVVLAGLVWLAPLGALVIWVPRFEELFKAFEVRASLPVTTEVVLTMSALLKQAACWFVPAGAAVVAGASYWSARTSSRWGSYLAWILVLGSLLAAGVCVAVMVESMFQPLGALIQNVQQGRQ